MMSTSQDYQAFQLGRLKRFPQVFVVRGEDTGQRPLDTIIGGWGPDSLNGREGDDRLFAKDGFADTIRAGSGQEVAGDSGQWDAGVDLVSGMEDPNPGR